LWLLLLSTIAYIDRTGCELAVAVLSGAGSRQALQERRRLVPVCWWRASIQAWRLRRQKLLTAENVQDESSFDDGQDVHCGRCVECSM